ncbi:unnamed protein product, partial [Urochloa humidicola]
GPVQPSCVDLFGAPAPASSSDCGRVQAARRPIPSPLPHPDGWFGLRVAGLDRFLHHFLFLELSWH